jgi:hypothetical protein
LSLGVVQLKLAERMPAVAFTFVGGDGAVGGAEGITAFDAIDAGPIPTAFAAVIANVYGVPAISPATTVLVALALVEAVKPPGLEVTV